MIKWSSDFNETLLEQQHLSDRTQQINAFVDLVLNEYAFIADINDLYIFEKHYYRCISKGEFRSSVRAPWQQVFRRYRTTIADEIYKQIIDKCQIDPISLNANRQYIVFENGVFNLQTGKLEEVNPDLYITNVIPRNYDEGECPLFRHAIKEILPDKKDRKKVILYLAYCLTNSIEYQMAQIWIGPPKSGKTSLQEFVAKLIGESASAIPFRDIIQDKGAICGLKGKRLNISSEIGGSHLNKVGIDRLKSMISDELLNGRDAYQQRESWRNTTKFIFTSNNLPNPRDADSAFWRRFQIVEFTQDFEGREDPTLFQRILEEEASQVIAYLLQFVSRVKETLIPSIEATEQLWHLYSGSVANFINQEVWYDEDTHVSCQELFERYQAWCTNHKFPPSSQKEVGSHLSHRKKRRHGEYVYMGMTIKNT